jgi:hypothetical protein
MFRVFALRLRAVAVREMGLRGQVARQQFHAVHVADRSFAPFRRCPRQVRLVGDFGHNAGQTAVSLAPARTSP